MTPPPPMSESKTMPSEMTDELRAKVVEAIKQSTPGPWLTTDVETVVVYHDGRSSMEHFGYEILGQDDQVVHAPSCGFEREEDAEFASLAHEALPLYESALSASESRVRELEAIVQRVADGEQSDCGYTALRGAARKILGREQGPPEGDCDCVYCADLGAYELCRGYPTQDPQS